MCTSQLSILHRSLITLSALNLGIGPRSVVLKNNRVTESDLREHLNEWKRLQVVHEAQQARYEHLIGPLHDV
jgi:hypothetical protein